MVVGIIDLAHCGTTMTAGVLERIGVPMVFDHSGARKLEDSEVMAALQEPAKFSTLVKRRGVDGWGFKFPGAWKYAKTLRFCLPEAVYVAIYKDPVSVTMRRFGTISGGKLAKTVRWMADNVDGLQSSGLEVAWLSYAHAMRYPCQFVTKLAGLAGVNVTGGQMDAVLEWMFPKGRDE